MKYLTQILFFCVSSFLYAQDSSSYKEQIENLNEKGNQFYFKKKDSAYHYFEKAFALSASNDDLFNAAQSLITISDIAGYHSDLKKVKSSLDKLDELLNKNEKLALSNSEKNYVINSSHFGRGMYNYLIDDFKKSREFFNVLVNNIVAQPDSLLSNDLIDLVSSSNSYISKMYMTEGKYDIAEQHYRNNISQINSKKPVDNPLLYGNYSLLAQVLRRQKKHLESNTFLITALKYNLKNSKNLNRIVSGAQVIAYNHLDLMQVDSAEYYSNLIKISLPEEHPTLYRYYGLKAEIEKAKNNYTISIENAQEGLRLLENKWGDRSHEQLIKAYNQVADIHLYFKNPKKALVSLNAGIKKFDNSKGNKSTLLKLIKNKAYALKSIHTNDSFEACIKTVNLGTEILDSLKPSFKSVADKIVLIEDAFPLFEAGLEASYQLYQSTKDEVYINLAFDYAEKSKSVLLLEAILSTKATQFANIPSTLLERERQLKSEIIYIEKQLNRSSKGNNEKEDQLFELKKEHRQIINTIETKYPSYYDLKYNTQTLALKEAQNLLKEDEKLISYFYGNDAIYALGIAENTKQIERIEIDINLEENIKQVHQMLSDSKSEVRDLAKISFKLYSSLVAPFIDPSEKKKLIIITDGLLNYIPFGALNTKENGLSYLVEKHSTSYANSMTLFDQLIARSKKNGDLLAFAPSFEGEQVNLDPNRDNLLPLPHNKREVEQILSSFDGKFYADQNATLKNFTRELSKYSILHLATHAIFDDASPEYSYLAFSKTPAKEDLLYVSDLYNLKIDADLVTLSACESGIGDLKRGEGFLSLARGFFYSGASSITSTLWKVNDASSTNLMDSFYNNLSDGDAKGVALQNAKKYFLETNRQNGLSHPYYWSGFVVSGNASSLVTPINWLWISTAIVLVALAGFLVFRNTKNS